MLFAPVGGGRYMFQVEGAASKSSRNMASSNHVGRKVVIAGKDNTLAVYQEKFDRRSSRRNVARAASRGGKASQEGYELMCRVDWLKSPIMSLSFSRQTFMSVQRCCRGCWQQWHRCMHAYLTYGVCAGWRPAKEMARWMCTTPNPPTLAS